MLYIKCRFIVNMICAFQDRQNLYMVLDLMPGGDLRFYMAQRKTLTEAETSNLPRKWVEFVIACTVLALEYMHTKGVIHRDVKPENLVIDKFGYIRLTDMGIARLLTPDNSKDTSGTPGYMGKGNCFENRSSRSAVRAEPRGGCRLLRPRSDRVRGDEGRGTILSQK